MKQTARITRLNPPLVTVSGLSNIGPGELVSFSDGGQGMVLHCSEEQAEIMVLSDFALSLDSSVEATGERMHVNADGGFLGRVISPLGEVLLGPAAPETTDAVKKPIDIPPEKLTRRVPITEFLYTGVSLVDSLIPLARGQRELVAGDRKTSKSGFLFQTMVAQVQKGSKVVFCLIGKRREEARFLYNFVVEHEMQDSVVIVASSPLDPSSQIILTPFTAMTVAEHFRDQGDDVLVIFDDLTAHARYYREVALLGRSFPGRDSYPGDIFYVHARLLERGGNFSFPGKKKKHAAITILPVVETVESELTDYIVSNLISITDGHLLFDAHLLQRGQRPPISTSLSVTRVGKQTVTKLQRQVNQKLSVFLNSYEKTLRLTQFGSELSDEARLALKRGNLLMGFLNQNPLEIVPITIQLIASVLIFGGYWDEVDEKDVALYRKKLSDAYRQDPEIAKAFEHITTAPDFTEFSTHIEKNAKALTMLCQS